MKSHVLVSRLVLQQQRVAREQDALDRADRFLGNVVEEPRSELRREVEASKAELEHHDRQMASLGTRLSKAEAGPRNERQTYRHLDAALSDLERELLRSGP